MEKKITNTLSKQDLFDLIEKITPLNNKYRDLVDIPGSGVNVLTIMWEVGNILSAFVGT